MEQYDLTPLFMNPGIGKHLSKDQLPIYLKSGSHSSYQIFLRGNTGGNCNITKELTDAASKYIKDRCKVFVHAPYTINLCKRSGDNKYLKMLLDDLMIALGLGFSGVVVHVGKHCTESPENGYENMVKNVVTIIHSYQFMAFHKGLDPKTCPLLIETPAGQGTEILVKNTELLKFLHEVRSKVSCPDVIKLCVDTCHIFAAGYEPIEYFDIFNPFDIPLIHLNGSKNPKGSKKDRHAYCDSLISTDSIMLVYNYAMKYGISMVVE